MWSLDAWKVVGDDVLPSSLDLRGRWSGGWIPGTISCPEPPASGYQLPTVNASPPVTKSQHPLASGWFVW